MCSRYLSEGWTRTTTACSSTRLWSRTVSDKHRVRPHSCVPQERAGVDRTEERLGDPPLRRTRADLFLVPLRQAPCTHSLGADPRPPGLLRPAGTALHRPGAGPDLILQWLVLRWQLEVTPYPVRGRLFQEVRTHLGVETQRQWFDLAIARTTPVLMGLFSWTTLAAHALQNRRPMTHRTAAWYDKPSPTFVDAIALVRRLLWLASEGFSLSASDPDSQELPVALFQRLVDSLAYAA